jgi:hypothetical protein
MLAAMIQGAIQVVAIIIIASLLGVRFQTGPAGLILIVLIAMLFSTILSGLSLALSASIKTMETLMAIVNFVTLPLMFTQQRPLPPRGDALLAGRDRQGQPGQLRRRANPDPHAHRLELGKHPPRAGGDPRLAILALLVAQYIFQRATTE